MTEIYKRDSAGRLRVWRAEVDPSNCRWRTHAGLHGGNLVISEWTACAANRLRSGDEQAVFEANAEREKKLKREYHETIEATDKPNFFKPMLAKQYEPGAQIVFPVWSQPKLDGIRCIVTPEGMFSREGQPIVSCPHIMEDYHANHEGDTLDGELYNHDLKADFNTLVSLIRRPKPTPEDLAKSRASVQFHCYDAPEMGLMRMRDYMTPCSGTEFGSIRFVLTTVVHNKEFLDEVYAHYLEQGYEGQMVRLAGPYEQKRSRLLLKRKEFLDGEFTLLRVEEGVGNWAGYAKRAVCVTPDGVEFGAGIRGNQEFTRELLANHRQYDRATIRYFGMTPDGSLRFPVATGFHVPGPRL